MYFDLTKIVLRFLLSDIIYVGIRYGRTVGATVEYARDFFYGDCSYECIIFDF